MSYAEDPESNPYAAPLSRIETAPAISPSDYIGYAGFWRRFGAYVIDYILMMIVWIFIFLAAGLATGFLGGQQEEPIVAVLGGYVVFLFVLVAYYAGMESSTSQATLGKMALGVKVTDIYGRRISFGRAVGRLFGKILSFITFYIGFIMAGFTEKKQALHDMVAGTLVLKVR